MPRISKKNKQDTKTLKTDILSSEIKINEKEQIKSNQSSVKSKKNNDIEVEVFDVKGQVTEKIKLPKEIFGVKVNEQLISQAIRVYLANQRRGTHSTKTRGEVEGSTRKIWRQKGTGRARHGGIRAPIFVKGGIVFGPKPRDYSLKLPQKMRQLALYSALSSKVREGKLKVLAGVTSLDGKTKLMFNALKPFIKDKKTSILFVMPSSMREVARSIRNIEGVSYLPVNQLNTYNVIANKLVIFMKEALDVIKKEKEK